MVHDRRHGLVCTWTFGYVHEHFEKYISEKDIKEGVLLHNRRLENLVYAKKPDDFLADLLKDRKKTQELAYEAILEKVSNKKPKRAWTAR